MKRKKKKSNKGFIFILLGVIIFVILGFFLLSSLQSGDVTFSVSGTSNLNGNVYYEERCIDVTEYKNDGYTTSSFDEKSCEIVVKRIVIATGITLFDTCNGGSGRIGKKCNAYGLVYNGCDSRRKKGHCGLETFDYKGGAEKVKNTCDFEANQLLAGETFSGGKTISKDSLRYPPVGFCKAHPSIITSDNSKQSITSTNVYDDLQNGKSVIIASDETLTLFYIIENNNNLPTICDSNENLALDSNNVDVCLSTIGFTYLCSEGQFDALSGTCVVQAKSNTICEKGRYDVNEDVCIFNPPVQVDCGDSTAYYSIDQDKCIKVPEFNYICPEKYTFYEPENQITCTLEGGIWELCSQCPSDKICAEAICKPKCSLGQSCRFEPDLKIICNDSSAKVNSAGECEVEGEKTIVCPDDANWNRLTETCNYKPDEIIICDGYIQKDIFTGNDKCIIEPEKYISCADDFVYNADLNKCVPSIIVYEPETNDFVIYREVRIGCVDDSECEVLDKGLECSISTGICFESTLTISELEKTILSDKDKIERLKQAVEDNRINLESALIIINNLDILNSEKEDLINSLDLGEDEKEFLIDEYARVNFDLERQVKNYQNIITIISVSVLALFFIIVGVKIKRRKK